MSSKIKINKLIKKYYNLNFNKLFIKIIEFLIKRQIIYDLLNISIYDIIN